MVSELCTDGVILSSELRTSSPMEVINAMRGPNFKAQVTEVMIKCHDNVTSFTATVYFHTDEHAYSYALRFTGHSPMLVDSSVQ